MIVARERESLVPEKERETMRTALIGLTAAAIVVAGAASGFAATAPGVGLGLGDAVAAPAAQQPGDIVIARRGADDPAGDDHGGRGKDDKGKDDKGGNNKSKGKGGKGRGGHDDGPNHT